MTYTVVALGDPIEQLHQLMQRTPVIVTDEGIADDLRRHCRGLVVAWISPRPSRDGRPVPPSSAMSSTGATSCGGIPQRFTC